MEGTCCRTFTYTYTYTYKYYMLRTSLHVSGSRLINFNHCKQFVFASIGSFGFLSYIYCATIQQKHQLLTCEHDYTYIKLQLAQCLFIQVIPLRNEPVTSAVIAYIFVDKFGAVFRILSSFHNSGQFNSHNSRTSCPIRQILVLLCSPGCRGGQCAAKLYNYILHVTQVTYMFKSVELVYRQNYKPQNGQIWLIYRVFDYALQYAAKYHKNNQGKKLCRFEVLHLSIFEYCFIVNQSSHFVSICKLWS